MDRRGFIKTTAAVLGAAAVPAGFAGSARAAGEIRVGLVAKSLGNGFFVAVDKGAEEAAKQIGNVKIIFTGPTSTTAEGQIEVIQSLIDQHVDAIAISANDPDALVPICKRAMARGIKVISYDSAVGQDGRIVHVAPSSDELIGQALDKLAAAAAPDGKGKFAIVSATPTSTNQNAWIAVMKKYLSQYPGLELVSTVYGNDLADDSYREATALLQKYPDLKVIVSPSSVGIVASAKAVEDAKKVGQVYVTGLGLPSECAGHVEAGSIKSFAIWNPIDLGYATTYVAVDLVNGAKGPGNSLPDGRMGKISFDANGVGAMAVPFTYDKSNVEQFAKIF
ncbi:rhamnose ABC transporter substrate-binding protein [Acidisoma silvae]|uniref:Rhamnose ABC transporter substrate-binding protein n=1 Tax=Acidisoma silvae TaxID=2802396 RepID=A0A963YNC1_9PROT|nr:rhamnose ABC transporter substrate-binding protein [Acidisoma silvae]MCB8874048.1 rhamnose ABC transporter substrate-binding protein [Acidisoma silvae]